MGSTLPIVRRGGAGQKEGGVVFPSARARDTVRDTDSHTVTRTMARVTRCATSYPSPMYKRVALVLSYRFGTPNVQVKQHWNRTVALVQSSRCGDTQPRIVVRIALVGCGTTTQCGTSASVPQKFEDCFNQREPPNHRPARHRTIFFGTLHW